MDIRDATLKDIITERSDFVDSILAGEHEGTVTSSVEKDKNGNMTKWTEERKDLDGKVISKRVDDYIYCKNGDVDQISLKEYNDKGIKISEKIVKHKKDEETKEPKI
jgi:hypothetical protein